MAKPRVFISSTFYDLRLVRLELDKFLESLGYEPVRNEEGDIPYGKNEALQNYCYKEIANVDILISIIGSRFGSTSEGDKERSVSNLELKTAIDENKHVFVFIEKNVFVEYETYLLNKENGSITYKYVDNVHIYKFIEEIKTLPNNNNIKAFETADDIISYLREQFAGLMKQFFVAEQRFKETNLIKDINATASTLKKLVDYIQSTNQDKEEGLKEIIKTSHPIIKCLKDNLDIQYKFYIEDLTDIEKLLKARGYKIKKNNSIIKDNKRYEFTRNNPNEDVIITLSIKKSIFDDCKKLKHYKPDEWKDDFLILTKETKNIDLPF